MNVPRQVMFGISGVGINNMKPDEGERGNIMDLHFHDHDSMMRFEAWLLGNGVAFADEPPVPLPPEDA